MVIKTRPWLFRCPLCNDWFTIPARWTVSCCFTYHKNLKGQNHKDVQGRKAQHRHDPHVSVDVEPRIVRVQRDAIFSTIFVEVTHLPERLGLKIRLSFQGLFNFTIFLPWLVNECDTVSWGLGSDFYGEELYRRQYLILKAISRKFTLLRRVDFKISLGFGQ